MALNQNQFAQIPVLGQLDLHFNKDTVSCEIDSSEVGTLIAGQAVKLVDSAGGIPKVVAVSGAGDIIFGYINYSLKDQSFKALDKVEVSTMYDNVMYLLSTAAVSRGVLVKSTEVSAATVGGVAPAVAGSGDLIVGWAYDKATGSGQLIRVVLNCPAFFKA